MSKGEKWRDIHSAEWSTLKGDLKAPSWSAAHELKGVANQERARDLIDYCYAKFHLSEHRAGKLPGESGFFSCPLVVDITQCVRRCASSSAHVRSICSGSTYYVYHADRLITAVEHMGLTGWSLPAVIPRLKEARLTSHMVRDLAGESFGMPCITLAAMSLILQMGEPFWKAPQ